MILNLYMIESMVILIRNSFFKDKNSTHYLQKHLSAEKKNYNLFEQKSEKQCEERHLLQLLNWFCH